ncbi:MAG: hypothetical protein O2954_16510 [bacterium]|nr:hypothetical protein [bacterium]
MIRWVKILSLVFLCGLAGCGGTSTYTSYQVVHSPDQAQPGEDIRLVSRKDTVVYGKLLEIDQAGLKVVVEGEGKKTFLWEEIRVLEKVEKASARK